MKDRKGIIRDAFQELRVGLALISMDLQTTKDSGIGTDVRRQTEAMREFNSLERYFEDIFKKDEPVTIQPKLNISLEEVLSAVRETNVVCEGCFAQDDIPVEPKKIELQAEVYDDLRRHIEMISLRNDCIDGKIYNIKDPNK